MSEENTLLQNLFPDGYPDQWNYDSSFNEYIYKIGSYKVEDLLKEPGRLNDERSSIVEHIQELAVNNYKTFIQTAKCSNDLFNQFNAVESDLGHLLKSIPKFENKCQSFAEETSGINNLRKLNSLTLTRNAQLIEVLELPQLMGSFIKDNLYESALELASYVRRIYTKHSDIPIFKSILDDVEKSWLSMLHQLLAQLRTEISLPKCLETVGYLRRMEVFSEAELRLKFLHTRDTWFRNCINTIPTEDATYHLNKTIEMTRVHLFTIITQYRAIFNDDDHSPLILSKNNNVNQNIIFFSWLWNKIKEFLVTLDTDLKRGVSSIDSILGLCMYFGLSFSRVGCDFRPLMVDVFIKVISNNFQQSILRATKNFENNIERYTLINKNHPSVPWKTKGDDPIQPPDSLIEFFPLAEYLNQVLSAFNELRLCCPVAIVKDVVCYLEESLAVISKHILLLYTQERQAFSINSKDAFTRFCMCFANDLVPYLQKCIHVIFPPSVVATHVGINVYSLQKEGLSFMDQAAIVEPIKHLLPAKVQVVANNLTEEDRSDDNNLETGETKESTGG